jgi:hypothetical protein
MTRRVKVRGVRREAPDFEQLALIYWLQAKRIVRERRERAEKERKAREAKRAG